MKYRYQAIEFVEREEQYQASLNTIIDLFYKRLLPYLDMMDMKELFANIFEVSCRSFNMSQVDVTASVVLLQGVPL